MHKIMIRLNESEFNALIELAKSERRGTREQAEWIICERLRQLGLLPSSKEIDSEQEQPS